MNDWKILKINDLPSDILTGDYEWEVFQGYGWEGARAEVNPHFRIKALEDLQVKKKCRDDEGELESLVRYRYRKPAPKPVTHEQIMTLWWKTGYHYWEKVDAYHSGKGRTKRYEINDEIYDKEWFTGRESAVIPPEEV